MCLPREISHVALERRVRGELAGKRAIDSDRMGEVSRGHSSRETHRERPCGVIVERDKVKARTEREDE